MHTLVKEAVIAMDALEDALMKSRELAYDPDSDMHVAKSALKAAREKFAVATEAVAKAKMAIG